MSLPINDPVGIFAVVLFLVFVAPIISEWLKIPSIIGLIISGIIFGPYVLNIIEKSQQVKLLSSIGLIFIMFLSGLEIDLAQFKRNKRNSLLFGLITFAIPFILGFIFANYLKINMLAKILFASMFSSHTLVTFPIVSKSGLSKRDSVIITIGGTIITDLLALFILAIVIGSNNKFDFKIIINLFISTVIFFGIVLFLIPIITKNFFKYVNRESFGDFIYILTVLFIVCYISHLIKLEAIIGAFIVGLTLNKYVPEGSLLMNRIKFVADSMFIPFFLISIGLIINPFLIFKKESLIIIIAMSIIIFVSKYLAAFLTGKILKFSINDINLMFGMSINQAAATLAASLVAYQVGLFDEKIIAGTVIMILTSIMIGSIFTNYSANKLIKNLDYADNTNYDFQRILIYIPDINCAKLLDFATIIKDSNEPLYPINIVTEIGNEEAITKSENILTRSIKNCISNQIPVYPVTRAEGNLVEGFTKSIFDLRITDIILGINSIGFIDDIKNKIIIDRIINNTEKTIYLIKNLKNINIIKSLYIFINSKLTKHNGFNKFFKSIEKISQLTNSEINIISDSTIDNLLKNKKINWIIYEKNLDINEFLEKYPEKDDILYIFCTVRSGDIGWVPYVEKMKKNLLENITKNLIITYLDSGNFYQEELTEKKEVINNAFYLLKKNILYKTKETNIELIFRDIFSKNKLHYSKKYIEEIIDLNSDISLFHLHSNRIREYTIYFVINKEKKISNIEKNVLLLLFIPEQDNPEKHLSILTFLAKIFSKKENVDFLLESMDYNDFIKKIKI